MKGQTQNDNLVLLIQFAVALSWTYFIMITGSKRRTRNCDSL